MRDPKAEGHEEISNLFYYHVSFILVVLILVKETRKKHSYLYGYLAEKITVKIFIVHRIIVV